MGAFKNQRAAWHPIPMISLTMGLIGRHGSCAITDFLNFFTDNRIFSTDFEKFVTNSLILYKTHYQLHGLLSNLVAI